MSVPLELWPRIWKFAAGHAGPSYLASREVVRTALTCSDLAELLGRLSGLAGISSPPSLTPPPPDSPGQDTDAIVTDGHGPHRAG